VRARQRGAARIPVQLLELSGALEPVENAYYVNMWKTSSLCDNVP
jgi:hypothetical protein